MSNNDLLKKFAEKIVKRFTDDDDTRRTIITEENAIVSDLTALISEHYYPKEFIVWKEGRCKTSNREGKYLYWEEYYTLDELYNYWKENEQ